MTLDPVVTVAGCGAVAWLFAAAALHKLRDWRGFRLALAGYRLVPGPLESVAAGLLVVVELAVSGALLLAVPPAALAAAGMLTLYALAMAVNLLRGRRLADCGCGGVPQPMSWALVARNLVLAVAALTLLLPVAARPLGWLDGFTAVAAIAAAASLYAAINALLAAATRLREAV